MIWIKRIFSGLVAVFIIMAAALWLFGSYALPKCDARAALDTVRQVVIGNMNDATRQGLSEDELKAAISFSDIAERRFDETADLRECTATLDMKVKDTALFEAVPIAYTMSWKDKEEGIFTTRVERVTGN